jgi:hypothetical protein
MLAYCAGRINRVQNLVVTTRLIRAQSPETEASRKVPIVEHSGSPCNLLLETCAYRYGIGISRT